VELWRGESAIIRRYARCDIKQDATYASGQRDNSVDRPGIHYSSGPTDRPTVA